MKRRAALKALGAGAAATAGLQFPFIRTARAQDRYAKYRGSTIVVNVPAHPHYDVAMQLVPEFTKQTGIKVELDKMQYLRMHDKQVLEMAQAARRLRRITYVVMWKTEYVTKNFLDAARAVPVQHGARRSELRHQGHRPELLRQYRPGRRTEGLSAGAGRQALRHPVRVRDQRARLSQGHPGEARHRGAADLRRFAHGLHIIKEKERIGGLTSRGQAGHQVTAAWLFHLSPYGGEVFDAQLEPGVPEGAEPQGAQGAQAHRRYRPARHPELRLRRDADAFLQGDAAMYLDATAVFGPVRDGNSPRSPARSATRCIRRR